MGTSHVAATRKNTVETGVAGDDLEAPQPLGRGGACGAGRTTRRSAVSGGDRSRRGPCPSGKPWLANFQGDVGHSGLELSCINLFIFSESQIISAPKILRGQFSRAAQRERRLGGEGRLGCHTTVRGCLAHRGAEAALGARPVPRFWRRRARGSPALNEASCRPVDAVLLLEKSRGVASVRTEHGDTCETFAFISLRGSN